jgi:SAM-dependent methyltransferase
VADFPWPKLKNGGLRPRWNGKSFKVGRKSRGLLCYGVNEACWDENLTRFHEATAGSDHPIDRASRDQVIASLKRFPPQGSSGILEVGSSSGFLLPMIRRAFPRSLVIGSDAFPETLSRLADQKAGIPLLQFDITRCPLPDNCLDAVIMLNVLEHIRNDGRALREVYRILRPGGLMVLEVPAGPFLYDMYDALLKHRRRYRARELKLKVSRAGFENLRFSHLGVLIYPAFAFTKLVNRYLGFAQTTEMKKRVASNIEVSRRMTLMSWMLSLEGFLHRFFTFPFGIRCTGVWRKPCKANSKG